MSYYNNELEAHDDYPSGEWSGYFQQPDTGPQRHWMSFRMEFRGGSIRGDGTDFVGPFSLAGKSDVATGRCFWTKQYVGKHQVTYQGLNQGQGIVGEWVISGIWTGQFHIWPKGLGGLEEHYAHQEVMRQAW